MTENRPLCVNTMIQDMFNPEDPNDDGTFYFETDYQALKGNPDYLKLMKTLAILEVQRMKVCQDIEKLQQLKMKVREDPEGVRDILLSTDDPCITRCEIEKVPEIDWTKYRFIDFDGKLSATTRRMAKKDTVQVKQESDDENSRDGKEVKIRGRLYTDSKPESFNQLWTVEEQLRLEQLLIEFPPEPIESRRWKKIADALGSRTTKQVCSRVQKYFAKLQKAGIAVPGRAPRGGRSSKPAHVHRRHKYLLYRPTTFFPGEAMKEELAESDSEGSGFGDVREETSTSQWIAILAQIKQDKENETETGKIKHLGFKCGSCGETPIFGPRWACARCPDFSLCADCTAALYDSRTPCHPVGHPYKRFIVSHNPFYSAENFQTSNYLDPNFSN